MVSHLSTFDIPLIMVEDGDYKGKREPEAFDRYISTVTAGQEKPLNFTFYVPAGYDNLSGSMVPNVEVTSDPTKILTVTFEDGKEIWPEAWFEM